MLKNLLAVSSIHESAIYYYSLVRKLVALLGVQFWGIIIIINILWLVLE